MVGLGVGFCYLNLMWSVSSLNETKMMPTTSILSSTRKKKKLKIKFAVSGGPGQ